jgi:hypothetical protein
MQLGQQLKRIDARHSQELLNQNPPRATWSAGFIDPDGSIILAFV